MSNTLPDQYRNLDEAEIADRIKTVKNRLGKKLVILGHHYQQQSVIDFADHRGDSLGLAKKAATLPEAEYIVFCGVNFMAEAAAIVCREGQRVFLPDHAAGCPLADTADIDDVEKAWSEIGALRDSSNVIPISYVNSSAELKAFVGRNGGACCTSSNVQSAFKWGLEKGDAIFFTPDGNLGRNSANALGIDRALAPLWKQKSAQGGLGDAEISGARVLLWDGHCHVHTRFSRDDVGKARKEHPNAKIIVHPECDEAIVNAADGSGSTQYIKQTVENAPAGTEWIIGTEINMVDRLGRENPDKKVYPLAHSLCPNMFKINPGNLLYTLENLPDVNEVTVAESVKHDARLSLDRMLEIG